jgi:hypothetical protein
MATYTAHFTTLPERPFSDLSVGDLFIKSGGEWLTIGGIGPDLFLRFAGNTIMDLATGQTIQMADDTKIVPVRFRGLKR